MNYKRKYMSLLDTGLIDKNDRLLFYSTQRGIVQKIKNNPTFEKNIFWGHKSSEICPGLKSEVQRTTGTF